MEGHCSGGSTGYVFQGSFWPGIHFQDLDPTLMNDNGLTTPEWGVIWREIGSGAPILYLLSICLGMLEMEDVWGTVEVALISYFSVHCTWCPMVCRQWRKFMFKVVDGYQSKWKLCPGWCQAA